jgi:hypothetical protein
MSHQTSHAYEVFLGRPEEISRKTKMRWENSFRMNLREIGWTGLDSSDTG